MRDDPPPDTPDGRYFVVRGRLWRRSDPSLAQEQRAALVADLMRARRAVGQALRRGDSAALTIARGEVDRAKILLGERGPVWWDDGAPDLNRRTIAGTPYAAWFAALAGNGSAAAGSVSVPDSAPDRRSRRSSRPR
jgi:hypothetical protein